MESKHILVTGGTGAIGSNLVRTLLAQDDFESMVILDNNSSGHSSNVRNHPKITLIEGDICSDEVLDRVFEYPVTHVYHLAANFANQSSVDNPVKDLMTNGVGIVKVLERASKHKIKKFLYTGSSCVYKPTGEPFTETSPLMPSTPYAITKLLSEQYLTFFNKYKNLPAVGVRYFSSYGPGDYPGNFRSVIPNFIWKALRGEDLTITGTGQETRPFTYIDDIVRGTILAMERSSDESVKQYYTIPLDPEDNLIFNIGTEQMVTMIDLAEKINALCGNKSKIVFVPRRDWDVVPHRPVSAAKAKEKLGFVAAVSIDEGLARTVEWFRGPDFDASRVKF